jgi:DNA-binding MarR family transcriptional regulator
MPAEATSIRAEIRRTRPFSSVPEEAIVTLLGTADRIRTTLARVVEGSGITLQQYNVLRILRGAGPDGLATLEIGARVIEQSPGITRLLDRLEQRKLVRRKTCPEDRRRVLCWATPSALRVLDRLERPLGDAARRCFAPLGDARTAELVRTLDEVRAAAASPSARAESR